MAFPRAHMNFAEIHLRFPTILRRYSSGVRHFSEILRFKVKTAFFPCTFNTFIIYCVGVF